jgi:hypothetical protein
VAMAAELNAPAAGAALDGGKPPITAFEYATCSTNRACYLGFSALATFVG